MWKPKETNELPQQHVCKEEEILADQQICDQERNSSLEPEDSEKQVKEEQEEVCTSREGEQLVPKEEIDTFMLTPYEEDKNNEGQTLDLNPDETLSEPQRESLVDQLVISSVVGAPDSYLLLQSNNSHIVENQVQKCEPCEKDLTFEPNFHTTKNTGEKKCICATCGKHFRQSGDLSQHMRIHTEEKPYVCKTCGEHFRQSCHLSQHMRIHTEEKPYVCKTCGEHFRRSCHLKIHMRIHTEEKPYICKTCGEHFRQSCHLKIHMRIHTEEKPYICKTCGEHFRQSGTLSRHMRIHTDESVKVEAHKNSQK